MAANREPGCALADKLAIAERANCNLTSIKNVYQRMSRCKFGDKL
jgi:hypothetical protein